MASYVPTRFQYEATWVTVTIAAGGTASESFNVSSDCEAITIIQPATVIGTTWKLQKATPQRDLEAASLVWTDLSVFDSGAGTIIPISITAAVGAFVIHGFDLGHGVFRIVSASTETSAVTFIVTTTGKGV